MSHPLLHPLMEMLTQTASQGQRLPLVDEMADRLGTSSETLGRLLTRAVEDGAIRIQRQPSGRRRIYVTAIDAWTDWNHRAGIKLPKVFRGERLPEEMEKARLYLQSRGYVVHRARVVDPKADPGHWVIGRKGAAFTDADLMNFARSRGWQQSERRAA